MDDSSSIIDDTCSIRMDDVEEDASFFDSMTVDNPEEEEATDDHDDAEIIILISIMMRTFMHVTTCLFQQPAAMTACAVLQHVGSRLHNIIILTAYSTKNYINELLPTQLVQ
eukprot:scaffold350_cov133-Cylindrotheca_fusiformis.AAC.3